MNPDDDHDNKKVVNALPKYRNLPASFKCENCDYSGYTIVEQRTTYISYILMILFIFIFGIYLSIIMTPLVILLTRTFVHKCPSCFTDVGSDNKLLSIFNMRDKVISISIGELGIVLSRRIILGIILTILLIFTVYVKIQNVDHHDHPLVWIEDNASWETFMNECGTNALHKDPHKMGSCNEKYLEKTVMNWSGYMIRIDDYRNNLYSYLPHALVIFVRMEPHESEIIVDISLAIDSRRANEFNDLVVKLNRGNEIIFNATIITIGDDHTQRHFHIRELAIGTKNKELAPLIHERGRLTEHGRSFRSTNTLPNGNAAPAEEKKQATTTNNN